MGKIPLAWMLGMATAMVAACSTGGGGLLGDAGVGAEPGDAGSANTARGAKDGGATATDPPVDTTPSYPITCSGLCTRAEAELGAGCDVVKCTSQCNALATKASSSACATEWHAYLDCAVRSGQLVSCAATGKLSLTHCSSFESALTACEATPPPTSGQCVAKCTTDQQCQSSCPKRPSGTSCCDVTTGICYASSTSVCPTTITDGGPPPAY